MVDTDVRALVVVSYDFGDGDYIALRTRLMEKSRSAVRVAVGINCYLAVSTFPLWKRVEDAMQFAPVQPAIDITTASTICYQLNRSPIEDLISDDLAAFSQEEIQSPRLLTLLSSILEDTQLMNCFVWIGECNALPPFQRLHRNQAIGAIHHRLSSGLFGDLAYLVD